MELYDLQGELKGDYWEGWSGASIDREVISIGRTFLHSDDCATSGSGGAMHGVHWAGPSCACSGYSLTYRESVLSKLELL